jgi:membrane-bound lytic murein transglycosylase B
MTAAALLAALALAHGPAALARDLTKAQATIDDRSSTPAQLAQAGFAQQLAIRELVLHGPLRAPTLRRLHGAALANARACIAAGRALAAITPAQPKLPPWRIVPPAPSDQLLTAYRAAQAKTGVGWSYLAAINFVETRMGRIRGTSRAGARGPMQFMPATWRRWVMGSIDDPRDAILAAARLLAAGGAPEHMSAALYGYNHSRRYVAAVAAYAAELRRDPRAFRGYHAWRVLYRAAKGTLLLPEGFPRVRAVRLGP